MGELKIDYDKLFKRASAYGRSKGLGDDSEDFAQEALIKSFEVGAINLEYIYKNYVGRERADKRILSAPQGSMSVFKTISLDRPIDESDSGSTTLADVVGFECTEYASVGEIEFYDDLLGEVLSMVKENEVKAWALGMYMKYLEDNI